MLKNYLLITLRSMMKNKLFIMINVFGMAVAIAQYITGYFAYEYDQTFDQVHQNQNRLNRVSSLREFDTSVIRYGYHESGGIVEG